MNGYGQQVITPEQYGQALQAFDALRKREMATQNAQRSGDPFMLLGNALAGLAANKFGKHAGMDLATVEDQLTQFQAQKEAEMARIAEAKAQREAQQAQQAKYQALLPELGEQGAKAVVYGGAKFGDVKQKMTDLQRNLQDPTAAAYLRKKAEKSGITVNNMQPGQYKSGSVPDGYAEVRDENGIPRYVKVQGHPVWDEKAQAAEKQAAANKSDQNKIDNIQQVGQTVLKQIGPTTAGFIGGVMKNVDGSEATDLDENLKTLQADSSFSTLMEMKKASPTGGALGSVSERELQLLGSAQAALTQRQSPGQLRENVKRYLDIRQGIYNKIDGVNEQPQPTQSADWSKGMSMDDLIRLRQQMSGGQ